MIHTQGLVANFNISHAGASRPYSVGAHSMGQS